MLWLGRRMPSSLILDLDFVAEVSQRTSDPVVTPAAILPGHLHNQTLHLDNNLGRPRYDRFFEPSNFCATSLCHGPRMVSGFAT